MLISPTSSPDLRLVTGFVSPFFSTLTVHEPFWIRYRQLASSPWRMNRPPALMVIGARQANNWFLLSSGAAAKRSVLIRYSESPVDIFLFLRRLDRLGISTSPLHVLARTQDSGPLTVLLLGETRDRSTQGVCPSVLQ